MAKPTERTRAVKEGEFSPTVRNRATDAAERYALVVGPAPQAEGRFMARCVEIPTVFAFGANPTEALQEAAQRLFVVLETMIEAARPLPTPMSEGKRDVQVNVKLTQEERLLLDAAAKRSGAKGLGDFFRASALAAARSGAA